MAGHDGSGAAESWFLARGLPAVLPLRSRSRHLLARMAPALAAYATVIVVLLVVYLITGSSEVAIDGAPTASERVVLAVLVLVLPAAVLVGWLIARVHGRRAKSALAIGSLVVAALAGLIQGGASHLVGTGVVLVVVAVLTATGVGAVLSWAVRLTMSQVAAMGGLFIRALPVMLLTVVLFFNSYVWLMAASISRPRLWLAVLFLIAVTCAFIASTSHARVGPMLESIGSPHQGVHDLSGTPFEAVPDPPVDDPLTRTEHLNVVVVFAAAQVAHLLMVAVCTSAIYFVLGLILLTPTVLAKWTGDGAADGTVLGMTIPVPQSLIHMTMVLIATTFMYVAARSVGDEEYKRDFLGPLIEDLHTTLLARNRYRAQSSIS